MTTTNPPIPNVDRVADYTAGPPTTDFAITWPVYFSDGEDPKDDLMVEIAGSNLDHTDFTFTGNVISGLSGVYNGGTVTLDTPVAATRVIIWSKRDPRRIGYFLEGKPLAFTELDKLMNDFAVQLRDMDLATRRAIQLSMAAYIDGGDGSNIVSTITALVTAASAASATASSSATAAASSATSAAADLVAVEAALAGITFYTRGRYNKFLDFVPSNVRDGVEQTINTNVWSTVGNYYLDAYFADILATGKPLELFPGTFHLNTTINMPVGMEFHGAGQGQTVFYPGAPTSADWGLQQLQPNGTASVEGFKVFDIQFQLTSHGLRWNNGAGAIDDTAGSQNYIMRGMAERCSFYNDSGTHFNGIEFNKVFNGRIRDCDFSHLLLSAHFRGSDICSFEENRTSSETDGPIFCESVGTFGGTNLVHGNDFNNPKNFFVKSTALDVSIEDNHMELDGSPGSSGVGGNMPYMIDVSGNSFHTRVHNNRVQGGAFADNYLRITNDVNRYLVSVFNNSSSGPSGSLAYASQYYFNNGGGRCLIRHGGNTPAEPLWPMNTDEWNAPTPPGMAAYVTAGRPGFTFGVGNAAALYCSGNDFVFIYNSNAAEYYEISDYSSLGLPANQLIGTLTIKVVTAGGAAGQILNWEVLDNGSSVATGTITHTVANQYYQTTLVTSHAFATKPQVRFWNIDAGHGSERDYLHSAAFLIG